MSRITFAIIWFVAASGLAIAGPTEREVELVVQAHVARAVCPDLVVSWEALDRAVRGQLDSIERDYSVGLESKVREYEAISDPETINDLCFIIGEPNSIRWPNGFIRKQL